MERNPALRELDVLVGEWRMELSNASFLPDGASAKGTAWIGWSEDASVVRMRQGSRSASTEAIWTFGRDEGETEYVALYADARGVSRVYRMSLEDGLWRLWREDPGFSQRFTARIEDNGAQIRGSWEKKTLGGGWEHDFDVLYSRRVWGYG